MATAVSMPKLGLSMVEGTVSKWLLEEGQPVERGQPIVVVETAKINYEVEAPVGGSLRKILCADGDVAPVGGVIGVIGGGDEEIDLADFPLATSIPAAALPAGFDPSTTQLGRQQAASAASSATVPEPEPRTLASPAARRLAAERGVQLHLVEGSGPRGRIQLSDVESHLDAPAPAGEPRATLTRRPPTRRLMTGTMRPVIARNMEASKRLAAHATMSLRADATELVNLRRRILDRAPADAVRVTYTDVLLKAVARALIANPMMRTFIDGDDLVTLEDIDISLAVHLTEAGLVVPVIRDCDRLTLQGIAQERTRLMEAGRAGRLGPDDSVGGCFTITNMGAVYDLDFGTPIINLPQSAILGVGSIRDDVLPIDGVPTVRPALNLFLSIDHRVIDGEPAVRFLNQVRDLLEDPGSGFARF